MLDRGDYTAVVKSMGCSDPDWTRYLSGQFNRKHLCIPSLRIDRRFHYACYQTEGLQSRRVRQALSNNPHEASGSKAGGRRVGGCQRGRARHDRRDAPWTKGPKPPAGGEADKAEKDRRTKVGAETKREGAGDAEPGKPAERGKLIREREGQAEREAGGCKIKDGRWPWDRAGPERERWGGVLCGPLQSVFRGRLFSLEQGGGDLRH